MPSLVDARPRSGEAVVASPLPGLTVVVPVFDEAPRIEAVVRDLVEVLGRVRLPCTIAILNDGSGDWSAELEARLRKLGPVEVHSFYPNRGKGAMLDRAFDLLDRELAVVIDADGEYAASDVPRVLAPLLAGEADWVMGSRYGFGRPRPRQYLAAWCVNRLVNRWFHLLSGVALNDLLTGLYAFRTASVADVRLRECRFAYTAELVWKVLARTPLRIAEVPIGYRFRSYAEGKKIRWWETGTILLALWRYRSPRGRASATAA
jgi:glycosyltransferase involved in cell wall biosynthesis